MKASSLDEGEAKRLIGAPSESLSLELKAWLNLENPEHKAKLVRAFLALRNYNGGYVVIGFDDRTGDPSPDPPNDTRTVYHVDDLQRLVTGYASELFGIDAEYPERNGVAYPVVKIPAGVRVPVAVKKDIQNSGGKPIVRRGEVPFRTLRANNTVSSAPAAPEDWREIVEICFANRESDLAGFVRRHLLSSELPGVLAELGAVAGKPPPPSLEENCRAFADKCRSGAAEEEVRRSMPLLPSSFGSIEVAAVLNPPATSYEADTQFLLRLIMAKPQYDHGLWLDTRSFQELEDHPIPDREGWQTLVDFTNFQLREFARLDKTGRFYVKRPLTEDTTSGRRGAQPGKILGIEPTIAHVAEAMAVVLSFSKSLSGDQEAGRIGFLIRLTGLKGRRLVALSGIAAQLIAFENKSVEDEYDAYVEVPIATVAPALGPFAAKLIKPLFALFNGYSMDGVEIERRVAAYINRQSRL